MEERERRRKKEAGTGLRVREEKKGLRCCLFVSHLLGVIRWDGKDCDGGLVRKEGEVKQCSAHQLLRWKGGASLMDVHLY